MESRSLEALEELEQFAQTGELPEIDLPDIALPDVALPDVAAAPKKLETE